MSEEVRNARTAVPKALMASVFINGVLGFGMLVAVLFCIGSIPDALDPATGFAFIEVLTQALNSNGFATGLTAFILVLFIFCAVSCLAAASRVTWAFARDDGLPGSSWIKKVSLYLCLGALLTTSKGRAEKQAPRELHRGVGHYIHGPSPDQHRLIGGFQRHRFPRHRCRLWFLFHTDIHGGVPTSQGRSLGSRTMEYGALGSSG